MAKPMSLEWCMKNGKYTSSLSFFIRLYNISYECCNRSLHSRLGNTDLYTCSSINGEISLLRLKINLKNNTKNPTYLPDQTTTDNLFLPLTDMEEFISESDAPLFISLKIK